METIGEIVFFTVAAIVIITTVLILLGKKKNVGILFTIGKYLLMALVVALTFHQAGLIPGIIVTAFAGGSLLFENKLLKKK
jgi:hypothetical protein